MAGEQQGMGGEAVLVRVPTRCHGVKGTIVDAPCPAIAPGYPAGCPDGASCPEARRGECGTIMFSQPLSWRPSGTLLPLQFRSLAINGDLGTGCDGTPESS